MGTCILCLRFLDLEGSFHMVSLKGFHLLGIKDACPFLVADQRNTSGPVFRRGLSRLRQTCNNASKTSCCPTHNSAKFKQKQLFAKCAFWWDICQNMQPAVSPLRIRARLVLVRRTLNFPFCHEHIESSFLAKLKCNDVIIGLLSC